MDPYLEGPFWPTVHNNLVEEIARQLAPQLRPKYLAVSQVRVTIATPDPLEVAPAPSRWPDIAVLQRDQASAGGEESSSPAPLVLNAMLPETLEQTFVEIRDAAERRLVAAIEVLSLTNKRGDGLADYRAKRQEMLSGPAHFIEIDLLRAGQRFPVAGTLPSAPYFVFLSRANRRPRVEIWPIALEQELPHQIPVPLLPGDPAASINLQAALSSIYELFDYARLVSHQGPPPNPLSPEQAAWADERLRAGGMR
jgi:hypothetical protein